MRYGGRWRSRCCGCRRVSSVGAQQGPQSPGALFERARLLEENSKTLNEAIGSTSRSPRRLAPTGRWRHRRCCERLSAHQKLGQTEARALYEQLVRDYGDQPAAVTARARSVRAMLPTDFDPPGTARFEASRDNWRSKNADLLRTAGI